MARWRPWPEVKIDATGTASKASSGSAAPAGRSRSTASASTAARAWSAGSRRAALATTTRFGAGTACLVTVARVARRGQPKSCRPCLPYRRPSGSRPRCFELNRRGEPVFADARMASTYRRGPPALSGCCRDPPVHRWTCPCRPRRRSRCPRGARCRPPVQVAWFAPKPLSSARPKQTNTRCRYNTLGAELAPLRARGVRGGASGHCFFTLRIGRS